MLNVLIVDDEKLQRLTLKHIIDEFNLPVILEIFEAENGDQALQMMCDHQIAIIFMDIEMPEQNGLSAVEIINQQFPGVKIIILTAFDYFNYAQQALRLGVVDFLLKPVRTDVIRSVLLKVIDRIHTDESSSAEQREIQQRLEDTLQYARSRFVKDLIVGAFQNDRELEDRARMVGLEEVPVSIMVFHFNPIFPNSQALDGKDDRTKNVDVIDQAIDSLKSLPGFVNLDPVTTALSVLIPIKGKSLDQNLSRWAREDAEHMRHVVFRHNSFPAGIGLGRVSTDLHQMRRSYHEASLASIYALACRRTQIIPFTDVPYTFSIPNKNTLEKGLQTTYQIRCEDRAITSLVLVEAIEAILQGEENPLPEIKARLLELFIIASRNAMEVMTDDQQRLDTIDHIMTGLASITSKEDLKKYSLGMLEIFLGQVFEQSEERHWKIVQEAAHFLKNNYRQKISLDDVAQIVHLSPEYFSRLFRKLQNISFSDYLTNLRLEKAKQLLVNSVMTIEEIASEVGYIDPNYFCRIFSKRVGMSPTKYRKTEKKSAV